MNSPTSPRSSPLDRNESRLRESFSEGGSSGQQYGDALATGPERNSVRPKLMSIADRALRCQATFTMLLRALEARGETQGGELSVLAMEDQVGRFRLWAGNIGAFQEGRSSLDYRLRNAGFIAQNAERLLDSLQVAISKATDAAKSPSLPMQVETSGGSIPSDYETSSESSGSVDVGHPAQTELAEHYLTITEIIGRLFRLSIAIRSSSIRTAPARSASFVERDENGGNISVLFEQYIVKRISHRYQDLSARIVERLSRAISRRRRQFIYQRRHREKLGRIRARAEHTQRVPVKIKESDHASSPQHHELVLPTSIAEASDGPAPTVSHRSIFSDTTASQYILRPEQTDTVSIKSFSVASSVSKNSDLEIPPPILPYKDEEFECPYCFLILSPKYKKARTWRKHVLDDLEPYLCLFEDCPAPDQSFAKFQDWVYHEEWSHNLQWCCDMSSHELQLFESQTQLETHIQVVHHEDINDAGIRQLIERNQRPARILWTECPFCKFVPDVAISKELLNEWSQTEKMSKNLVKHVGRHLQNLSILALPWRDDTGDEVVSQNIGSAKADNTETVSHLDAIGYIELDDHGVLKVEEDIAIYELDLRPLPITENQRWDLGSASFEDVDINDPIIHHLYQNQIVGTLKSDSENKSRHVIDEMIYWENASDFDEKAIATFMSLGEQATETIAKPPSSIRSRLQNVIRRSKREPVMLQTARPSGEIQETLAPGRKVTPEEVRDLAELIRMRYELDIEIWTLRYAKPRDRPLVNERMRRSDAILQKIYQKIRAWNSHHAFMSAREWATFQDIKMRIEEGGKRHWASNPPWND